VAGFHGNVTQGIGLVTLRKINPMTRLCNGRGASALAYKEPLVLKSIHFGLERDASAPTCANRPQQFLLTKSALPAERILNVVDKRHSALMLPS
jgi:hypothetical protein